MRRRLLILAGLLLIAVGASAQTAASFQSVTVAASAVGLAGVTSADVRMFATLEDAQIRYRIDGSDPTAAVGHVLNAGDSITITGYGNINAFKAIRTGSTSGVLRVTLFQ